MMKFLRFLIGIFDPETLIYRPYRPTYVGERRRRLKHDQMD